MSEMTTPATPKTRPDRSTDPEKRAAGLPRPRATERPGSGRGGPRRRIGPVVAAVLVPAMWGLVAGMWTPRGPLTSGEAIWSLALSLAVGAVIGLATRSRWSMLYGPLAFVVVFELARLGTEGPMVDAIHLSPYGLLMLATGRGFHGLLSILPMAFGAALGAAAARRRTSPNDELSPTERRRHGAGHRIRQALAVLSALALVLLTVGLARPASTAHIGDDAGNPRPDSVAELTTVDVGGHDLGLMIRGHDTANPVVLFLAGGPGGTEYGAMRRHLPALEAHVTVATWDQRGSGTSYPELDPTDTITLDGYVADTIAVTEYLRDRFDQDQIYLMGQSWGTTLGVLAVQDRPDLYRAYIGAGQMVSQRETDRIFYADTLQWASETDQGDLVEELETIGPPPYEQILNYEAALTHEQAVYPYDHGPNAEGAGQMSENLIVSEYTLIDQVHALGAALDTFSVVYPQLQGIDFRETATTFSVPMFFAQGAHEAGGRAELFDEWFPMIEAPLTDLQVFETSGHRPLWEQPDVFVEYMVDTVLAQTADG